MPVERGRGLMFSALVANAFRGESLEKFGEGSAYSAISSRGVVLPVAVLSMRAAWCTAIGCAFAIPTDRMSKLMLEVLPRCSSMDRTCQDIWRVSKMFEAQDAAGVVKFKS